MYGSLEVICGPMYAGKTTETLKRVLWARNGQHRDVHVFKPSFDNRYSETEIVSHDGLRTNATNITQLPVTTYVGKSLVVLDEVQFFCEPYVQGDVVEWVRLQLAAGVDVFSAGLDMDWQGKPFEITAQLMAMADKVTKITAHCTVCGRAASKTYKKTGSGNSVELGALDLYEARCPTHWRELKD
jgi:thymidine kinase